MTITTISVTAAGPDGKVVNREVPGHRVGRNLAVTKPVDYDGNGAWNITHRSTGYAVLIALPRLKTAMLVARAISRLPFLCETTVRAVTEGGKRHDAFMAYCVNIASARRNLRGLTHDHARRLTQEAKGTLS